MQKSNKSSKVLLEFKATHSNGSGKVYELKRSEKRKMTYLPPYRSASTIQAQSRQQGDTPDCLDFSEWLRTLKWLVMPGTCWWISWESWIDLNQTNTSIFHSIGKICHLLMWLLCTTCMGLIIWSCVVMHHKHSCSQEVSRLVNLVVFSCHLFFPFEILKNLATERNDIFFAINGQHNQFLRTHENGSPMEKPFFCGKNHIETYQFIRGT